MTTLKEAYDCHKKTLHETLMKSIRGFEVNTGCKVTCIESTVMYHNHQAVILDIRIKTDVDGPE